MKLRHPRTGRQLTPRQSELLTLARCGASVIVPIHSYRSQAAQCNGSWFCLTTWRALQNLFDHPTLLCAGKEHRRAYAAVYTLNPLYQESTHV